MSEKSLKWTIGTYNIVDREDTSPPLKLASPPIFVVAVDDLDNVTLFERELSGL